MRKRVLLAEASDTVRGVAESVLRQNGFEVIPVVSGEKALEVIQFSRPDIIIAGSDLTGKARKPLHEHIKEDPKVSSVPMIILTDSPEGELSAPVEATLTRPFEPADLIDTVNGVIAKPVESQPAAADNPLGEAALEDDFLDAALGLDHIHVTDSEVMDRTQAGTASAKSESHAEASGSDDLRPQGEATTDSRKVESLIIREDDTDIRPHGSRGGRDKSMSSSGKIEILDDQFGLSDDDGLPVDDEDSAHDYQWFINEMQKDVNFPPTPPATSSPADEPASSDLSFSEPSSMVDPVTPPPKASSAPPAGKSGEPAAGQFINEFRREMEKMRSDEPDSVAIDEQKIASEADGRELSWQDTLEKMTPEEINLFTRQFVAELADRIARLIAAKIDDEKLLSLLKKEIIKYLQASRKPSS
ncbi:MAG: hypothetical protein JSW34_01530 [Candidatus Zixiibacteriota bacterium]|nr:MAG: hypothetical protein JSW34_01530 [candidate division Zixibacteria bacterium]